MNIMKALVVRILIDTVLFDCSFDATYIAMIS